MPASWWDRAARWALPDIMLHNVNWLGSQDAPFEGRVKVRSDAPAGGGDA